MNKNNDNFQFRAWDKGNKLMVYYHQLEFAIEPQLLPEFKFAQIFAFNLPEATKTDGRKNYPINCDDYILMQSPGVRDRGNNLIYVGDKVAIKNGEDIHIGIVRYSPKNCSFNLELNDESYHTLWHEFEKEILGNIYEKKYNKCLMK